MENTSGTIDRESRNSQKQTIQTISWAGVAPTEYVSSFTLTQKKPEGISFHSQDKRFKTDVN